ncbi:hypothetical protein [Microbacterium sp. UBA837]|uniref:hypothetical protein n=1 Tax=Microbacterium sp. UBA837 TaxID=1946956 RepID=UPI0025E7C8EE|nr:hypothetical protein [Microbacterium sp. UBA837]|tara:strand:- start:300 stop:1283 length:984 start_codon:yes stop_codon:yes gene_type:complete
MDISNLNIRGASETVAPEAADDVAPFTTGTVYEVDPGAGLVRVGVAGGAVWLPAIAARYTGDSLARVLLDPFTSRPVLVAGAVRPRDPAVLGRVTAGPTSGMLTVEVDQQSHEVPALPGAYSVDSSAWVQLDDWGVPFLAIGPSAEAASAAPSTPSAPDQSATEQVTVAIGPQWSGTWRQTRWGNWNQNRYGGISDIYQGSYQSSGTLLGFAAYGDQVVNLGAVSIEKIKFTARKNDTNGLSAALTVQGSPHGARPSGAPSSSGDTASTPTIGPGGWGSVELPASLREAFRTGAAKGLCAVGGAYGGFGGTATPGSFVLEITYTRNV